MDGTVRKVQVRNVQDGVNVTSTSLGVASRSARRAQALEFGNLPSYLHAVAWRGTGSVNVVLEASASTPTNASSRSEPSHGRKMAPVLPAW